MAQPGHWYVWWGWGMSDENIQLILVFDVYYLRVRLNTELIYSFMVNIFTDCWFLFIHLCKLFGSVPPNKKLFRGTVPTVPLYNKLFRGTVPPNSHIHTIYLVSLDGT